MKSLYIIILTLFFVSCGSDELTNSKAKKIISKCLKEKPLQQTAIIKRERPFTRYEDEQYLLKQFEKLKEQGFVTMSLFNPNFSFGTSNDWYKIELVDKAKKYLNKPSSNKLHVVNTYVYLIDEILEVHEIPSFNTAQVKAKMKTVDVTPFSIIGFPPPDYEKTMTFDLVKSADGWKYCD